MLLKPKAKNDKKLNFAPMGAKPKTIPQAFQDKEDAADAKQPGDKKEDAKDKKPSGKKANSAAKKAALQLAKG